MRMNDLVAAFNEYFEVISADSPQLLEEVFRLRYQVLCIEQRLPGFIASDYMDGLEKDDEDHRSVYILLRHRPSKTYVGTARLLLADPTNLQRPFPVERQAVLDSTLIDATKLSRRHTAEISRFAILSRFPHPNGERRRGTRRERQFNKVELDIDKREPKPRRRFPHPFLALAVGVIRMCAENNIVHWLSVMDPALNRLLSLYGLHLDPVGPLTEYHGLRRPYFIDLARIFDRTYNHYRDVWELVTDYGKFWPVALERRTKPRDVGGRLENALVSNY